MNGTRLLIILVVAGLAGECFAGRRKGPPEPQLGELDEDRLVAVALVMETEHLANAQKLHKAKDYSGALKAYQAMEALIDGKQAAEAKAIKPHVVWMIGVCHLREKRLDEARKEFERALGISRHPVDAALADYYIGTAYKSANETEKAIAHYDAFIRNPERKKCMEYYNKALDWQYRQYIAQKGTSEEWTKRYYEFLHCMAMARPAGTEWFELYQYHLGRNELEQCIKVAGYKMSPQEAVARVFEDVLGKAVEAYNAAADGDAKLKARSSVAATVADQQKQLTTMKELDEDTRRTLFLEIVKTQAACMMPKEAGAGITAWMKSRPDDKIALFAFDGYVDKDHPPDTAAYDTIFLDYMKAHPDEKQVADLYAAGVCRAYGDRSSALKVLKSCGTARAWHYAMIYDGWQDEKAEPHYRQVAADGTEQLKRRLTASRWLGLRCYDAGKCREAAPLLQQALELQAQEGRMFAHELPEWRHKLADSYQKTGDEEKAGALWAKNCERHSQPHDPVLRAIATYEGNRHVLKHGDQRAKEAAERTLREFLGQDLRRGQEQYAVKLSSNEEIRKLQEKARALLLGYKVKLDFAPSRNTWK